MQATVHGVAKSRARLSDFTYIINKKLYLNAICFSSSKCKKCKGYIFPDFKEQTDKLEFHESSVKFSAKQEYILTCHEYSLIASYTFPKE